MGLLCARTMAGRCNSSMFLPVLELNFRTLSTVGPRVPQVAVYRGQPWLEGGGGM